MYMRANVEIFLKGTAGQDADGEWGRNVGVEVGETRKVLGKGCTPGSARFLGEERERKIEVVDRVRYRRRERGWSFGRFVREGSVLGSRNMV